MSRNLMTLCCLCGLLLVTASACRKGPDANAPAAKPPATAAPTAMPVPLPPTPPMTPPATSPRPTTLPSPVPATSPAPATAAAAAADKEAESLIEKIMALIKDGKLDDAQKLLDDLKAKAATLPQSIQDKIKAADTALAAKKAAGSVTVPKLPG